MWTGKDGREVVLKVNMEKAKQMFMCGYQKTGRNHNVNVSIKSFKDMVMYCLKNVKINIWCCTLKLWD